MILFWTYLSRPSARVLAFDYLCYWIRSQLSFCVVVKCFCRTAEGLACHLASARCGSSIESGLTCSCSSPGSSILTHLGFKYCFCRTYLARASCSSKIWGLCRPPRRWSGHRFHPCLNRLVGSARGGSWPPHRSSAFSFFRAYCGCRSSKTLQLTSEGHRSCFEIVGWSCFSYFWSYFTLDF